MKDVSSAQAQQPQSENTDFQLHSQPGPSRDHPNLTASPKKQFFLKGGGRSPPRKPNEPQNSHISRIPPEFYIQKVPGDGNCLFTSISRSYKDVTGVFLSQKSLRQKCVDHILCLNLFSTNVLLTTLISITMSHPCTKMEPTVMNFALHPLLSLWVLPFTCLLRCMVHRHFIPIILMNNAAFAWPSMV